MLTAHHGFPARTITPGWAGAASCKWLMEVTVLDKPAEGNFMSPGYRMPNTPVKPGEAVKPEDTHSITASPIVPGRSQSGRQLGTNLSLSPGSQLTYQGERVIHFCEFLGDQLTSNLPCIKDLMLDYRTNLALYPKISGLLW